MSVFPFSPSPKTDLPVGVAKRGRECFPIPSHCSFPAKTWQVSLLNHHWFTSPFIPSIPEITISSPICQLGNSLMGITGVRLFYLLPDRVLRKKRQKVENTSTGLSSRRLRQGGEADLRADDRLVKAKKNFEIYRAQWLLSSKWIYDSFCKKSKGIILLIHTLVSKRNFLTLGYLQYHRT